MKRVDANFNERERDVVPNPALDPGPEEQTIAKPFIAVKAHDFRRILKPAEPSAILTGPIAERCLRFVVEEPPLEQLHVVVSGGI